MGFAVDDALARDLRQLTELEVSFALGRAPAAGACSPRRSSVARSADRCCSACRRARTACACAGHEHRRRRSPGAGHSARRERQRAHRRGAASLARRRAGRVRAPAQYAVRAGGAEPAVSIVGSVAVARNITRPLESWPSAAARIEQGDYGAPVDRAARRRDRRAGLEPQSHARQHRRPREAHPQARLRGPAHRSRQPLAVLQRARAAPSRSAAQGQLQLTHPHDGSRPLQVRQRHARPWRGRSRAARSERAPASAR